MDSGGRGDESEFIDPFNFQVTEPNVGLPAPGATGVRARFSASMIKRAEEREVGVLVSNGDQIGYLVGSLPGETKGGFHVYMDTETREWECSCYQLKHGDVRKRKGCTHLAAVLLRREAEREVKNEGPRESVDRRHPSNRAADPVGVGAEPPSEVAVESVVKPEPFKYPIHQPDSDLWKNPPSAPPFPSWVKEFRPHQWKAAIECVEAFQQGADIVWLDAPTGAGKTLIAELVRRLMAVPAWYICTTKTLQDQFARDFSYGRVLKGRSNYTTMDRPFPEYSANDCTNTQGKAGKCFWCSEVEECPYTVARDEAVAAELGVINTSYLLAEANTPNSRTHGRELVIADECDTLESDLMGYVTYEVSARRLGDLGLTAPKKGSRKKTIWNWMGDELLPAIDARIKMLPGNSSDVRVIRERSGLYRLKSDTEIVLAELEQDIENGADTAEASGAENWVRDNNAGPLVMKPVRVERYGNEYLWSHGDKWLCMSGTIVSADEMNESLGVNAAGLKAVVVKVPMTFPVEHRPVIAVPVAVMSFSNREEAQPVIAEALGVILRGEPDERVLVHAVSYEFSSYLHRELANEFGSRLVTHGNAAGRDEALAIYRSRPGAVLISPSMDRGVDLKGDDCRVVVVTKIPFGNLGDRQVGARLKGPGGQQWYNVQAIRTLLQMTGRGVRSKDDWCTTYILDAQFTAKIWKVRNLIPDWWIESVQIARVKDYIK